MRTAVFDSVVTLVRVTDEDRVARNLERLATPGRDPVGGRDDSVRVLLQGAGSSDVRRDVSIGSGGD